jgi:hypothetical protein
MAESVYNERLSSEVPAGHRLVTCSSCDRQQLVPEDDERDNCYCGSLLPKY